MSSKNAGEKTLTIHKLDENGLEVWNYTGTVLQRDESKIQIEARYNFRDKDLGKIMSRLERMAQGKSLDAGDDADGGEDETSEE